MIVTADTTRWKTIIWEEYNTQQLVNNVVFCENMPFFLLSLEINALIQILRLLFEFIMYLKEAFLFTQQITLPNSSRTAAEKFVRLDMGTLTKISNDVWKSSADIKLINFDWTGTNEQADFRNPLMEIFQYHCITESSRKPGGKPHCYRLDPGRQWQLYYERFISTRSISTLIKHVVTSVWWVKCKDDQTEQLSLFSTALSLINHIA